jgi:hypothetical protein
VLIVSLLVCETTQSAPASTITIGEINVLSTADSGNKNLLAAQNATLSQPATIKSLSFYVTQASGKLILGIYDASGPNGGPGALKAQTNSFTPVVGWNTANVIAPVSLPAGTYWLAYLPSSNSLAFVKGQTSDVSNHYYFYPFGALPATFSPSPSADPYHWSIYATLNPAPTISSISVSKSSFAAGAPSGTVVGSISVSMSSGSFTGSLSLNGANASDFKIVGSTLETNAVLPSGSYNINIVATQRGAANSRFTQAETITAVSQSISSVSLSNASFVGGSPSGTVVGTISVTMSPASPAFFGSLSLSTTQGGCTATNGADNSSFAISGNNFVTNGIVPPGSYAVCIVATQASASNGPVGQAETLTGGSTTVKIGESNILSTADSGNGNLLTAQNATLSQPATIQSLSFYVTQASGNLILGLYDATGPNGGPAALTAQTNSFTRVVGWNTANVVSPVSLPAGTYWLAYLPSSSSLAFVKGLTSGLSNRYYSYLFGALPAQFSTSPSSDSYHWSFYATLNTGTDPESISSLSLSNSSVAGDSPSGTVVGTIIVTMSPSSPTFSGSLSLSTTQAGCTGTNGANNSSFAISGGNLVTNGTLAPGSYAVCILATQAGATNSPLAQALTITVSTIVNPQTPSAIAIGGDGCGGTSCSVPNIDDTFANNVASGLPPNGTYVGTLSTTLSSGTPPFAGSYTILNSNPSGGKCTTGTLDGAATTHFQIARTDQLQYKSSATAGTSYNICLQATSGSNSTTQEFTVTVHSIRNASAASSGCTGTGTSASPWNYLCIQNAANAAAVGDTVFLPGGNWALRTGDATYVSIDKAITFLGAGSGNTFDTWGHINNASATDMCPTRGAAITCLYTTGTSHPYGDTTLTGGTLAPAGGIIFGNGSGSLDNNCVNLTIANMFVDGSQATDGGGVDGLMVIWNCAGPTLVTNIRHLMNNGNTSAEGMFYPVQTNNLTVQHSLFAATGGGEAFQTNGGNGIGTGYTINNIVMWQYTFNPITISNIAFMNSQEYVQNTSVSYYGFMAGSNMGGGNCSQTGVTPPGGTCDGDYNISVNNNLFWGGNSRTTTVGGSINDPSTSGGIAKLNLTGNWVFGSDAEIDSCEWFPRSIGQNQCTATSIQATAASCSGGTITFTAANTGINAGDQFGAVGFAPSGYNQFFTAATANTSTVTASVATCPGTETALGYVFQLAGVGMTINTNVDSSCNVSDWTGQPFNVTNNSIVGTSAAAINVSGNATVGIRCWLPGFTGYSLIPINVYNFLGQKNYLSSPSNQYITNAATINPTQSSNYCNGKIGTWSGGSACNTSNFSTPPTVSFTLGNLFYNPAQGANVVPIISPTFSAQYGAVQWVAVDCATPCSSPPTTPLSSDSRWSSNNGSFPNSAANSYIPPVSLSGVGHGNTVYLWVMDSANNISALASAVVP